jgi:hypothetical protein
MTTGSSLAGSLTKHGIVIVLVGLGLAWLSLAVTVDNTIGRSVPAARHFGAGSANIMAQRAEQLAVPNATAKQLADAQRLGRGALTRDPANVAAVRALGQVAALHNDMHGADRLFNYAETLSRRDLMTQLWQIEASVRANDVAGTLRHYDRALRTNARARPLLFPVLVSAAAASDVTLSLGQMLAARPSWALDFIAVAAGDQNLPPATLATLLEKVRLRTANPAERAPLASGLSRLVAAGRYREAQALYRQATGLQVSDQGFDRDPVLPPFDWTFANDTDLVATIEPRGQGRALELQASNGQGGEFARRMLVLAPGSYRLAFTASGAGADSVARAAVSVQCASGTQIVSVPVAAQAEARAQATFTVPANDCSAQWLIIAAPAGLGAATAPVIVQDLSVRSTAATSQPAQ